MLLDPGVGQNTILSDWALVLEALLAEFALYQNSPDPFNPEMQIADDQAEDGNVLLQIYSVTGQLVHTLVQDGQPADRSGDEEADASEVALVGKDRSGTRCCAAGPKRLKSSLQLGRRVKRSVSG